MAIQSLRGTKDLLPDELDKWRSLERLVRSVSFIYGYKEIRTPIIEDANLFSRSIGETTDIVQKEMFRFEDRGGGEVVLRPEGTASIVRAYLENNLHKTHGFCKLFYIGAMFRAERPQAGRLRQFHQYGVEAIDSASPWVDVEVISLCLRILRDCDLRDVSLWLSSMGCRKDQEKSASLLRDKLSLERQKLCKDCQSRFAKNIFRILDCKNPACHAIAQKIPSPVFALCGDCQVHFDVVRQGLRDSNIAFDDSKMFARGLDYYTRTVFEVRAHGLGSQDAVAAGGRYDHLSEELGGPSLGAVGFAAGMERVLMAMERKANKIVPSRSRRGLYLAVAQPSLMTHAFRIVGQLRERGLYALIDYDQGSLKSQLREADKADCRLVAILGESEMQRRVMTIKDLDSASQRTISFDAFIDEAAKLLGRDDING